MRRLLLILLAAAAASQDVRGDEVVIATTVSEAALRGTELTLVAQRIGDAQKGPSLAIKAGDSATLALSSGSWIVSAETPGLWSPSVVVETRGGATVHTTVPIVRAVTVTGQIVLPQPPKQPPAIKLYFQWTPEERVTQKPDAPLGGEHVVAGRVEGDRASFEIPAGRFDLALRIPGYTSVYRWDRTIVADAVHDLGALQFRRGTTISGRIAVGSTPKKDLDSLHVALRPEETEGPNDILQQQAALRHLTSIPTARGFFHFDVQPGTYLVQAVAGKYRSEEQRVTATETTEAVLKSDLLLEAPRSLSIHIDPPLDPTGRAWRVTLDGPSEPVTHPTADDGSVTFDDLYAIPYRVDVGRGAGDAWYSETVDVGVTSSKEISIPLRRVKGKVLLGTDPLKASLTFVDDTRTIGVRSRKDGTFVVDLPIEKTNAVWKRVQVESGQPYVRAAVEDVKIEDGKLTITISDRTITGEVVDAAGKLAPSIITVNAPGGQFQIESDDGMFSTRGLSPGRTTLTAFSAEGQTERAVIVEVPEEDPFVASVQLELQKAGYLHGQVLAAQGPVSGAAVWCMTSALVTPAIIRVPTDVEGKFRFARPNSADRMTCSISPAGFATRLLRVAMPKEGELKIFVRQNGALLNVQVPEASEGRQPYLFHDGAPMHLRALEYLAGGHRAAEQISFFVEEGAWSLCLWNEAAILAAENGNPPMQTCHTVFAASGSTVSLHSD